MNAAIITIGDEILIGQIVDTNSAWIAQQLVNLQIPVSHIHSISDDRPAIHQALDLASSQAQLIIVTGGLGPTKDDLTKESISSYFNTTLIRSQPVLDHVQGLFRKLGYEQMPEINKKQADVLENAHILFNEVGTAPGMWIDQEGRHFVFLPGVPFEMMHLMTNKVIPRLETFRTSSFLYNRNLLTIGLGESHLAEKIADIEAELPADIKLAFLPKIGLLRLRMSGVGNDEILLKATVDSFVNKIAERLKEFVVALQDITMEEVFIQEFTKHGLSVSTAESCTGGGLGAKLTQYDGASRIYQGSIAAYSNVVKRQLLGVKEETLETHGAVSEETVMEMAYGAKRIFKTDYSIATSGIAGPTGGTLDKPVGTVWIAVVGKHSYLSKKFNFHNNRVVNIERTIANAWLLLWKLYKAENAQ